MRPERLWMPRHRFQMIEQKYEFQEQHPEIRDQKLECFIKKFFDIFMENYILEDETNNIKIKYNINKNKIVSLFFNI